MRDNPGAELHLLDTGHFALEDRLDEIATLMRDFLDRKLPPRREAHTSMSIRTSVHR